MMAQILKVILRMAKYIPTICTAVKMIIDAIRRTKMGDEKEIDIQKVADLVLADLAAVKAELKDFKGPLKDVIKNIPEVVKSVEKIAADIKLAGDKKRELAVCVLNRLIDIPMLPESAEAVLIGLVVDAVVAAFNKIGKDWLGKVDK